MDIPKSSVREIRKVNCRSSFQGRLCIHEDIHLEDSRSRNCVTDLLETNRTGPENFDFILNYDFSHKYSTNKSS